MQRLSHTLRAALADAALYFLPLLLWLLLFSCGVSLIPDKWKPPINVTLLPKLDALMGSSVTWFGANTNDFSWIDLVAAVPYTIHPVLPFLFLLLHSLSGAGARPLLKFVLAFGVLNLVAVLTHLVFPTAPPWYFLKHGMENATYDMKGDPAVLARLDERFGMEMYHRMYEKGGKVVFGAWPSLHAAWPYLMARFRPPVQWPALRMMQWAYVVLVWWAAVYLKHHYLVDLLGGILYAEVAYQFATAVSMWKGKVFKYESLPFFVK